MATQKVRLRIWLLVTLGLVGGALLGAAFWSSSGAAPAAPLPSATVIVQPAGHFGGWPAALTLAEGGNRLYLGEGNGFTVFDVSDKAQPRQRGGVSLHGNDVNAIAVSGAKAYLSNGRALHVVDIADPSHPTALGKLDLSNAQAVAVSGAHAFVGAGDWLHTVDISNPLSPTLAGGLDLDRTATSIQISGALAYVGAGPALLILDVSNPVSPTLRGSYTGTTTASKVQVVGTTAYVAAGANGLLIVDASNPLSPTLRGAYNTAGSAGDVQVVGATAFIADGNPGVVIVNVSNPISPTLVATTTVAGPAIKIGVDGSYAYVLSWQGMSVLDVRNPAAPVLAGAFRRPSVPETVAVAGTQGYMLEQSNRLWVLDTSNPAVPRTLSMMTLGGSVVRGRVATSGTLAYVVEPEYGVEIVDASNPLSPTLSGRYPRPGGTTFLHDVFVQGRYAYVPMASGGAWPGADGRLHIVDVSNPLSPTLTGAFDTPGNARRVVVSGTVAFVADGSQGLRLVNVANPLNPVALGAVPPPTTTATAEVVLVRGSRAYVGSNQGGNYWLQEVNISDPANPAVVKTYQGLGAVNDLSADDAYLYTSVTGGSLHVFDFGLAHVTAYSSVSYSIIVVRVGNITYIWIIFHSWGSGIVTVGQPGPTPTPTRTLTAAPSFTPTPTVFGWTCCQFAAGCGMAIFDRCLAAGGIPMPGVCTLKEGSIPRWQCLGPTGTPTPTGSPTATGTPTPTGSPTVTGTPTATGSPTVTGTPTPTGSPTITPTPTTTGQPPVVKLISEYEKYFLKDVSFKNCYRVDVQWNGPPGYLEFTKNDRRWEERQNPTKKQCFDMGFDFNADDNGGNNVLTAIATNGLGLASEPAVLQPLVFPIPGWISWVLQGPWWTATPFFKLVHYATEMRYPNPAFEAVTDLPRNYPVIGGKWGVKETQIWGRLQFKSDGGGLGRLTGNTGVALGEERALVGSASGEAQTALTPGGGLKLTKGILAFTIKGLLKIKKGIADLIPALKAAESWTWLGGWIKELNDMVSVELHIEPQVVSSLIFKSFQDKLQYDHGEYTGMMRIEGQANVKLREWLKAGAYIGGMPRIVFEVPPNPWYFKELGARLYAGAKLVIYKWEQRFEAAIDCFCRIGCRCQSKDSVQAAAAASQGNWQLAPRDYVTADYAAFVGNRSAERLRGPRAAPQVTDELPIIGNVFPQAEPALALRADGQQLLLWVHDDPTKPNGQGEEILFSRWDGGLWSVPAAITDDRNEDFAPQVAFDSAGGAIAVWERSKLILPISPTLDITFTQSIEIAYSRWDGTHWSVPALLTNDSLMDFGPALARAGDGRVMALWQTSDADLLTGDATHPISLTYAIWNGAAWSAPAVTLGNITGIFDVALAYRGPQAAIVLSRDTDGDAATSTDKELFYAEWDGTRWGSLIRLTNNTAPDLAPQVAYDAAGQVMIVWLQGDRLVYQRGWSAAALPLWPDGDVVYANYRLAQDPQAGHLALIYQGLADTGTDISYTIFDAARGLWSLPSSLTHDRALEDALVPVFAADGALWMTYVKTETVYETRQVEIDGETITFDGVPAPGRSDLYLLRHLLAPDLALDKDAIALSAPNPVPGQRVVISATVRNAGDLAVTGGMVQFYDGQPGQGGVPIGASQALTSPLRAGMTDTVSVAWIVPAALRSHDLWVVADPLAAVAESDETNNQAQAWAVLPNLQVADFYLDYTPSRTAQIRTTVANSGTIPATAVLVVWRRDAITGTLLGVATIPTLAAGDRAEAALTWNATAGDVGQHTIYALVDPVEAIRESDETDNTDLMQGDILPDLTLDGSYFDARRQPPPGPLPITLRLSNRGVAPALAVRVRVVQGRPFTDASPVLYERIVARVEAGETVALAATITPPGFGDVYAVADAAREVAELYEDNNVALLVDFPPHVYLPLVLRR